MGWGFVINCSGVKVVLGMSFMLALLSGQGAHFTRQFRAFDPVHQKCVGLPYR